MAEAWYLGTSRATSCRRRRLAGRSRCSTRCAAPRRWRPPRTRRPAGRALRGVRAERPARGAATASSSTSSRRPWPAHGASRARACASTGSRQGAGDDGLAGRGGGVPGDSRPSRRAVGAWRRATSTRWSRAHDHERRARSSGRRGGREEEEDSDDAPRWWLDQDEAREQRRKAGAAARPSASTRCRPSSASWPSPSPTGTSSTCMLKHLVLIDGQAVHHPRRPAPHRPPLGRARRHRGHRAPSSIGRATGAPSRTVYRKDMSRAFTLPGPLPRAGRQHGASRPRWRSRSPSHGPAPRLRRGSAPAVEERWDVDAAPGARGAASRPSRGHRREARGRISRPWAERAGDRLPSTPPAGRGGEAAGAASRAADHAGASPATQDQPVPGSAEAGSETDAAMPAPDEVTSPRGWMTPAQSPHQPRQGPMGRGHSATGSAPSSADASARAGTSRTTAPRPASRGGDGGPRPPPLRPLPRHGALGAAARRLVAPCQPPGRHAASVRGVISRRRSPGTGASPTSTTAAAPWAGRRGGPPTPMR